MKVTSARIGKYDLYTLRDLLSAHGQPKMIYIDVGNVTENALFGHWSSYMQNRINE